MSTQMNLTESFDIEKWRKGALLITRGGSFPVISQVWDGVLTGYVGNKQIQWNEQGQNLVREEYGYDLFMKS